MLKFSLPVIIGGSVLAVGATLGTVAVAMPGFAPAPEVTAMSTPTPSDTATGSGTWTAPIDNTQHEVAPGMRAQDLPVGFHAIPFANGVSFTYSGPCIDPGAQLTVWSNVPGMWKSRGDTCRWKKPGEQAWFTTTITWSEDTRNSYCYSPAGAQSAYRGEVFGLVTEWVSIPESYKVCVSGQKPEGAIPAPVATPTAAPVAPAPSPTSTSTSSASPSPTASATP